MSLFLNIFFLVMLITFENIIYGYSTYESLVLKIFSNFNLFIILMTCIIKL